MIEGSHDVDAIKTLSRGGISKNKSFNTILEQDSS